MELKLIELDNINNISPYLYKAIHFNISCHEIKKIELLGFGYNNIKNIYETIFNINSSIFNISITPFNSCDNTFHIKYECINTKYRLISQSYFNEKISSDKITYIKANIKKWLNDITIIFNDINFIQNYLKVNNISKLEIINSNIHYIDENHYNPIKLIYFNESGFFVDGIMEIIPYMNAICVLNGIISYLNNHIYKEEEDTKKRITFKKFIETNDATTNIYI
jgi:hypothetical protein